VRGQRPERGAHITRGIDVHSSSRLYGETGSLRPHEKEFSLLFTPSTYTDKILSCVDCNQEFVFAATDQQFYAEKEFSEPRRCPSCRAARKAARGESGG
jgi:hypothetical protein